MTVLGLDGSSPAPLLLDQDLGFEQRTDIVGAFVGNANFNWLDALVAGRRIKIQAVAACVQIGATVPAAFGDRNLVGDLDLRGAVVAPRNQMETRFNARGRAFGPSLRRRFRPSFAV